MSSELANEQLIFNALGFIGHEEIDGPNSDDQILAWIRSMFPGWEDDSTIAWCSVFLCMVANNVCAENPQENGHKTPGMARSWLSVGEVVDKPLPGDICILWRGSPKGEKGHVGLYCNTIKDRVYLLGGNQSDSVCVADYAKNRILGFRRLRIQH